MIADTVNDWMKAPLKKSKRDAGKSLQTYIHNVGTITPAKLQDVAILIIRERIDVCILLDAGVKEVDVTVTVSSLKSGLGPGYAVVIFPTVSTTPGAAVGGAVVITSNRLRSRQINQLAPLGTLVEVKGTIGNQPMSVYGVYSAITYASGERVPLPKDRKLASGRST